MQRSGTTARALVVVVLAAAVAAVDAEAASFGLRNYFDGLVAAGLPAQAVGNRWTFYRGSVDPARFLTPSIASQAYLYPAGSYSVPRVGRPIDAGDTTWNGSIGRPPSFDGLSIHPGEYSGSLDAVIAFTAPAQFSLGSIEVWMEAIQNANQATGSTAGVILSVSTYLGGTLQTLLTQVVDAPSTLSSPFTWRYDLPAPVAMAPADYIEIRVNNRGAFGFDQFNIEAQVSGIVVPEPGAVSVLLLLGACLVGGTQQARR